MGSNPGCRRKKIERKSNEGLAHFSKLVTQSVRVFAKYYHLLRDQKLIRRAELKRVSYISMFFVSDWLKICYKGEK